MHTMTCVMCGELASFYQSEYSYTATCECTPTTQLTQYMLSSFILGIKYYHQNDWDNEPDISIHWWYTPIKDETTLIIRSPKGELGTEFIPGFVEFKRCIKLKTYL